MVAAMLPFEYKLVATLDIHEDIPLLSIDTIDD